jgi:beta-glucosidase
MKQKKNKAEKAKKLGGVWKVCSFVFTILFAVMMVLGPVANNYASIINMVLGTSSTKEIGDPGETYFTSDYASSSEQAAAAEAICESVVANGAVLLLNNNDALPLEEGAKLSLLGKTSYDFIYGGTGSGGMDTSSATTLKDALEKDGFAVNSNLWDFYATGKGAEYTRQAASGALNNYIADNSEFCTNEVPQEAYSSGEWESVAQYGDAAIVVFGRVCGEGRDLPWYGAGDGDGNFLSLTEEERDLLKKLAEMKQSGEVQKIIVLLNTANAIELDFLAPELCGEDYGVDACMWIGEVGQSGIEAIGDLLKGTVNPSGKLVDTYCYDNLTSPALQNAYATAYTNASEAGLSFKDSCNEYYEVYQEGIYVGYRYYETRYEDTVLGQGNAGDFDYGATVAYSFGYGLSYSDFTYSPMTMTDNGDTLQFTVDVTNTSSVDGAEAVQIYMQSPYTDYDRENNVEKSAVELVGYAKQTIAAGETASYTIDVDKTELRAYDADGAGTYIVDAGNYYFAAGNGAHDALNNILAQKAASGDGSIDTGKMVGEGNAELAVRYVVETQDSTTYAVSAITGNVIENQLSHADLNKVDDDSSNDVVYLTRQDWEGTMPKAELTAKSYKAAVQIEANETIADGLKNTVFYEGASEMPVMGKEGDLNLALFVGVPLDGTVTAEDGMAYTWDDLLDQITFNEMAKVIGQAYHSTVPISSVNKPGTKDENGPQGITATLTGGDSSTSYTSEDLLAATFDTSIAEAVGRSIGNDCLLANGKAYSGIYGPGVNIHRTPYSGRNFEYYSEDPFISGKTCAAETAGIQSKGVYVYLKHFALNDQETARDGICVWTNEQAAREIYLQAFEYPIEEAGAYATMTSFNRLGYTWAGGDRGLLTNIARDEWGFVGFHLTDYSNSNSYMDVVQGLLAGGDAWDCNDASKWTEKLKSYSSDPAVCSAMREATEHILYTVVNSNAMNGVSPNLKVIEVMTWWQILIIALDVVFGLLAASSLFLFIRTRKKK